MATVKISSDVNRILFVKNLNYNTPGEDINDLFVKNATGVPSHGT